MPNSLVRHPVEEAVNNRPILRAIPSVRSESRRRGISEISGCYDTNSSFPQALEKLCNTFNFGVVPFVWAGVGVHSKTVDTTALLDSVQVKLNDNFTLICAQNTVRLLNWPNL
jgi:hypothetical protein